MASIAAARQQRQGFAVMSSSKRLVSRVAMAGIVIGDFLSA